ncbi:hypothetical protein [Photobacterium indicum]|uniref:Uncharacterized protein n=1 Tax=Photobacterium indicum TaxID=81447 RepID=A0A2T3L3D8_9GAMM|nr:hypothetical protein [Photobacterium indicum]PSV43614.1 hypothetical protein C9J47_22360 [Photobacterium indicum]
MIEYASGFTRSLSAESRAEFERVKKMSPEESRSYTTKKEKAKREKEIARMEKIAFDGLCY